jgi:ATP-binding cassette subfamily B protein
MKKVIKLPLGFFENNTSGKLRKIIDDNAGITHSFLAHQLPDLAGTFIVPITTLLLIFIFDWKLGIVCLIPLIITVFIMRNMMLKKGKFFTQKYMTSLENMNTEAVEYVRGIPVVKIFQQTIYSFKSFYKSIIDYRDMVYNYTLLWKKPMSTYNTIINSFAYFLIIAAIFFINNS